MPYKDPEKAKECSKMCRERWSLKNPDYFK
jgi:hypothetical protein